MKRSPLFALACAALIAGASLAQAAATPAKPAAAAKPAAVATAATPAKPAAPLVDLNSASKEELIKLPGVGEAIAGKIIAGRPWASKAQLLSKNVVNKATYQKLAPLVVAKQK